MEKINVRYEQLIFIYAYLRQVDLSLDRCRWESWAALQNYFSDKLQPSQIIGYLRRNLQLSDIENDPIFSVGRISLRSRLKSHITKSLLLEPQEILYCCKLLSDFEEKLKSNNATYNEQIEKLRIDIAEYYIKFLGSAISKKDLNRLMNIEHYGQSNKKGSELVKLYQKTLINNLSNPIAH